MIEMDEQNSEIEQTWNKIETISRKTGLREGISAGRESNFQKYFDIGYSEGFKSGYVLGKYRGFLAAHSKQNGLGIVDYPLLEKTRTGGCEVCKNNELLEDSVSTIIKKQTDASNKNVTELYSTFSKTFSCKLPQNVDDVN